MTRSTGGELADVGDLVVSPGLVDTHVHVNEPGRTEWEGFDTGDARGGGRRRDDDRRHAAEQHSGDDDVSSARGEAGRGARAVSCRRRRSGAASCPATRRSSTRWSTPASAGSSASWCRRASTSSRGRARPISGARCRSSRAAACRCSSTPNRRTSWIAGGHIGPPLRDDRSSASYTTYLATRPPEAEVEAIRMMVRLAQRVRLLACTSCTSRARGSRRRRSRARRPMACRSPPKPARTT